MQTKAQKSKIIIDLTEKAKSQRVTVFANFHGLSVTKQQELRRLLKKEDAEYKVAKKTLFQRAFEAAKVPFSHMGYKGELSTIFGFGDEISPVKSFFKFARANSENVKIIGGILGTHELSGAEVMQLAKLPTKQELIGQLAAVLISPIRGLMNVLNGNQRKLVVALAAVAKNKS